MRQSHAWVGLHIGPYCSAFVVSKKCPPVGHPIKSTAILYMALIGLARLCSFSVSTRPHNDMDVINLCDQLGAWPIDRP